MGQIECKMEIKAIAILVLGVASAFSASWETRTKEDELVILLTGGDGTSTSAEVLSTNGTSICNLPQMSQSKFYHSQSGLTACGGLGGSEKSCIQFQSGSWITLTENLLRKRRYHSNWKTPTGDILLIGGDDGGGRTYRSTEIVDQSGNSIQSFKLKYKTRNSCSIELPEMFIMTGGYEWDDIEQKVSKYTTSGWIEDLPDLNEGRGDHGCGYFFNVDMERVFLVAGGFTNDAGWISSTEILVEGGQAWIFQNPLPSGRQGFRGVSLPDTVIMTGGSYPFSDDVLMFDPKTSEWKKIGTMKTKRGNHAASLVNIADVIEYCN